jgi:hypothetical protein
VRLAGCSVGPPSRSTRISSRWTWCARQAGECQLCAVTSSFWRAKFRGLWASQSVALNTQTMADRQKRHFPSVPPQLAQLAAGQRADAATCLRLQAGRRWRRYQGPASLPRPPQYPEYDAVHGSGAVLVPIIANALPGRFDVARTLSFQAALSIAFLAFGNHAGSVSRNSANGRL